MSTAARAMVVVALTDVELEVSDIEDMIDEALGFGFSAIVDYLIDNFQT